MKFFMTSKGLYAIEADGSQDDLIQGDWNPIDEADVEATLIERQAEIDASIDPRAIAQFHLSASDVTLLRCFENALALPPAWKSYRAALRAIVTSGAGPIPPRPDYPSGT